MLGECGLPGPDFLVKAPTVSLGRWLNRPAEFADFDRALKLLLMVHAGETPETVVEFTPHSCRHVQVTAGSQLAAQGLVTDKSMETLGQWEPGSKNAKRYDSAACVSELRTRATISDAIRSGWRPVEDGSLPVPPTPGACVYGAPATPKMVTMPATPSAMVKATSEGVDAGSVSTGQVTTYTVVNVRKRKAHCATSTSKRSICNWFTCGTIAEPAAGASFGDIGTAEKCAICFRDGMRRQ